MMNNNTKVWIFILSTSLALLIAGYELGERLGLLIGFFAAITINFFVLFYGETRILVKLQAHPLKGQDPWGLVDKVDRLAQQLQIQTPNIYLTPHKSANAFCVGQSWRNGALGFTTGLLQKLNEEELEAVIAHQLCHIRRLDTFAYGVSSTVANSIVGLGQFLDSLLPYKLQFFMPILSPLGWFIIKLVVGEKTIYDNDSMAAKLLNNRSQLGAVLWRLEGLSETLPLEVPPCTSHLFMVNPEGLKQRNMFLKSHPAIEARLKKLMGYYPI